MFTEEELEESRKSISNIYKNSESNKYLEKYGIRLINDSQSLKLFVFLLYNMEYDITETLKIKFFLKKNVSFGRNYLRYSLFINDGKTSTIELFKQISYDEYNYKDNSLFTIANIYNELYELRYDNKDFYAKSNFREDFRKLLKEAENEFISNNKKNNL